MTAAVKPKVEDGSGLDVASAAVLHKALFFPPMHLEIRKPEDGHALLDRKYKVVLHKRHDMRHES